MRLGGRSRLLTLLRRRGGVSWVEKNAILYDTFATDDAAPITSPRTCEPGPGLLNVIDVSETFSISGGNLVATANDSDLALGRDNAGTPATVTMLPGYGAFFDVTTANTTGTMFLGFDVNVASAITGQRLRFTSGLIRIYNSSTLEANLGSIRTTNPTTYGVVQRSPTHGYFSIIDNKLVWVGNYAIISELMPALDFVSQAATVAGVSLLPLADYNPAWGGDWTEVTDTETSPANGTTFDCDVSSETSVTFTYEAGKFVIVHTKYDDANNGVQAYIWSDGSFFVRDVVDSDILTPINSAGLFSDGVEYTLRITVNGATITYFLDNGLVGTFSCRSALAGNTGGLISNNLDTNDIVLTTHPYPALGIADDRVIAPQDEDTFTHSDDFICEIKSIQLPSSSSDKIMFRGA